MPSSMVSAGRDPGVKCGDLCVIDLPWVARTVGSHLYLLATFLPYAP